MLKQAEICNNLSGVSEAISMKLNNAIFLPFCRCPAANFGPLLGVQPHSSDVN